MSLKLEKVIPIGRKMDEYKGMFCLDETLISNQKIIDCAGGPSSFNCECNKRGYSVTSLDPIYAFTAKDIQKRVDDVFDDMFIQIRHNKSMFLWEYFKDVDDLVNNRREAIDLYLEDYEEGKRAGRYQYGSLPNTGFDKNCFDLALCSHFLFLYSEHLSLTFHISSIREMMQIADEARIFPVIDLSGNVSAHLKTVIEVLENDGYEVSLKKSEYEFLKHADQFLQVKKIEV